MADVTERTHRGRDAVRRWRARFRIAGRFLDKPVKILALIVLAGVGATLGMVFGGVTHPSIGPVETTMRIAPSWGGDSVLELPPLGTISLDSHDGPLRLEARVDRINQAAAEAIFKDPGTIANLEDSVGSDLRSGVIQTAVRGGVAGVLGAAALVLVVVRRWRLSLVAAGMALVLLGTSGIVAGTTYDPRAITEPKYTGLLTSAPSLIGNAADIAENIDEYQEELVRLVTNVTRLYDVTSTLPAYRPRSDVIRLLHVSDLHIMQYSWQLIASVVKQYQVDLVADSGDISDHGLAAENYYLDPIKKLGVPYVWVRGNHDSLITEQAMRKIKNAVVLDGRVREVSGIRFLGAGRSALHAGPVAPGHGGGDRGGGAAGPVDREGGWAGAYAARRDRLPRQRGCAVLRRVCAPAADGARAQAAGAAAAWREPVDAGGLDRRLGAPGNRGGPGQAAADRDVRAVPGPFDARAGGVGRDHDRWAGVAVGADRAAPGLPGGRGEARHAYADPVPVRPRARDAPPGADHHTVPAALGDTLGDPRRNQFGARQVQPLDSAPRLFAADIPRAPIV